MDGDNEPHNDHDIEEELQEIAEQEQVEEPDGPNPVQLQPLQQELQLQPVEEEPPLVETLEAYPPLPERTLIPVEEVNDTPPVESTGVRRSTRTRQQSQQPYAPSMSGKRYETAHAQPEMSDTELFDHMQNESPTIVAMVMTQLSMKKGLKTWGDKAKKAVYGEMRHAAAPRAENV